MTRQTRNDLGITLTLPDGGQIIFDEDGEIEKVKITNINSTSVTVNGLSIATLANRAEKYTKILDTIKTTNARAAEQVNFLNAQRAICTDVAERLETNRQELVKADPKQFIALASASKALTREVTTASEALTK